MGRGACRFGELPPLFEQQHPRQGDAQHRQPARTKSPTRRAHASSSEPYYTADRELEVRPAARARGQARHPGGWARLTRASARPPSSHARVCGAQVRSVEVLSAAPRMQPQPASLHALLGRSLSLLASEHPALDDSAGARAAW